MANKLVVRRKWIPWWGGFLLLLPYFGFAWLTLRNGLGPPNDGEALRIMVPPFLCLGYFLLCFTINWKKATVVPDSVTVTDGPLPLGTRIRFERKEIRRCYVRNLGTLRRPRFMVGVEGPDGFQLDISGPHPTPEWAAMQARKFQAILNQDSDRYPLQYRTLDPIDKLIPIYQKRVFVVAAIFIIAVLFGGYWQATAKY